MGIKYIQNGGYTREHSNKKIEEELKIQTLKNAKKSWIAIVISVNIIDTYSNKYLDYVYQKLIESTAWVLFISQF